VPRAPVLPVEESMQVWLNSIEALRRSCG